MIIDIPEDLLKYVVLDEKNKKLRVLNVLFANIPQNSDPELLGCIFF